ncbi:MAG: hypothetical protein U9R75_08370 [Candidatus Thermoplasmatota archaeon]|nr:hypothetical protein [Candidatus Thermoplasmatota archaeon]
MAINGFKISAEILQKNAAKASVRDLNAEFQMKGGSVIYKTSKKGDTYLLSHSDDNYLEEFKIRLFVELGLIKEKDLPKKAEEPKADGPRYGDKHGLRPGWNVRSPREFHEGRYDQGDRRAPEGTPPRDRNGSYRMGRDHDGRSGHDDRSRERRPQKDHPKPPVENSDNIRSFKERWPDVDGIMDLIEESLKSGAVDDGQIIKFGYSRKIPEEDIKKLKKILWDNRCRGERENCPHGKKKLRFEEMMKVCSGKVEGWKNIDSPFTRFLDLWKANMMKMYGDFADKNVSVEGKVSSYKIVNRKDHEHVKVLVYDTMVKDQDDDKEPRETRKLWMKITQKEFETVIRDRNIHLEDIVKFKGKCIYDKYFHDYWVVDIQEIDVVKEGDGEVIPPPLE